MRNRRPPRAARLPTISRRKCKAKLVVRRARGHTSPLAASRLRAGLSVREVARRAGFNPSTVSRIERGLQHATPGTLARIKGAIAQGSSP